MCPAHKMADRPPKSELQSQSGGRGSKREVQSPNPEPRTPNPEPRTPNPEPSRPAVPRYAGCRACGERAPHARRISRTTSSVVASNAFADSPCLPDSATICASKSA
ncbi:transcriptional regulator, TetR family domain protein [Burkholderia pseudomallei]|nr:transcriptional regulator, TetR family domain protein [Burkholderia pseudomallei]